ncbi:MAG: GNAT family N-acetyltransferase [Prevotella sp.]|nr:GNAT family N-acetyltransferase [Prevotella sp.]
MKERLTMPGRFEFEGETYILHNNEEDDAGVITVMHVDGISFARIFFLIGENADPIICSVSVAEKYRRKGYGTKLLRCVEEVCRRGGDRLYGLRLIVEEPDWRHEWYQRLGFADNFHGSRLWMQKYINKETK